MDRSVAHAPAEPHPVEHVVRRAARARRRHRVLTATGGALAVLVVAGAGFAGFHVVHNPDREVEPVTGVVGPVVHVAGAARAVAGRDYDLLSTYTNHDLDAANGRLYTQVTRDGEVLVQDSQNWSPGDDTATYDRYGLITPGSGAVRWLPEPPGTVFDPDSSPSGPNVVAASKDLVLWAPAAKAGPAPATGWTLDVFHRATRTWSTLSVPAVGGGGGAMEGATFAAAGVVRLADGRLWFTLAAGPEVQRLWSMPLDASADPRVEARVGDWDVDDTHLVWTDRHNTRADTLSVRDLASGATRTYATRSGARCNQLGLDLEGDRVALTEYCGTRAKVRDDRVHVVSTSGEQVLTVQGDGVEQGALGTGYLAVQSYGEAHPAQAGTYVYDFSSRTLRRLADGVGRFDPTLAASGPTLTWGTPVNAGKGMRLWAATWR